MVASCISIAATSRSFVAVSARAEICLIKPVRAVALTMPAGSSFLWEEGHISRGSLGLSQSGRRCGRNVPAAPRALDLDGDSYSSDDSFRSSPPPQTQGGSKLYVGNLPFTCDSQQLAAAFEDYGSVELVEVIYDRETGRSRGFGFVTMASPDQALTAIDKLDGSDFGGRNLRVNFPQPKEPRSFGSSGFGDFGLDRPPPEQRENDSGFGGGGGGYGGGGGRSYNNDFKLFVGNLSWGVDDASLESLFSDYGKVVEARVVYDRETGRSRGFGFVTFEHGDSVQEAISTLDGSEFDGRQLRVNVAGEKPAPRMGGYGF